MFGKPTWFRKRQHSWGLMPITVQGWVYALVWLGVLALPFTLLVLRQQPVEAMIWVVVAGGFLLYEVRHIMLAMQPPAAEEDVLYIGDDEPRRDHLATRKFDFQLRR